MALAVSAIHKGNLNSTRWMLFGTIIFGLIFLACQVYEFTHFVHAPGHELTLSTYQGEPHVFGSTFYVLTGTHGTHVAIGVFWLMGWLAYSFTGKMSTADAMDIECCGLYWHFVDIVWIIIFPVIYLMEYAFKLSIPNIFLMSGHSEDPIAEESKRFFTFSIYPCY